MFGRSVDALTGFVSSVLHMFNGIVKSLIESVVGFLSRSEEIWRCIILSRPSLFYFIFSFTDTHKNMISFE